jgi:hypothetical protein
MTEIIYADVRGKTNLSHYVNNADLATLSCSAGEYPLSG